MTSIKNLRKTCIALLNYCSINDLTFPDKIYDVLEKISFHPCDNDGWKLGHMKFYTEGKNNFLYFKDKLIKNPSIDLICGCLDEYVKNHFDELTYYWTLDHEVRKDIHSHLKIGNSLSSRMIK